MTKKRRSKSNINYAQQNTAVIYARYSSSNQREESIDAQVRACEEYAERNGYVIVDVYADSAKSATNNNRPELQRMLEDSKQSKFRTVIVHKLDRFSRNKLDSVSDKRMLLENGCRLVSAVENLDDSPESGIMESVLEGMAEYYSKNLAREVKKGQKETALKCKHNGGKPPLGYDVDKETQKYVINEKEAVIVRLIFNMYAKGRGYKEILSHLNAMGFRTKRGNQFTNGSLNNLLKNEKYRGIYIFNLKKEKGADGVRRPTRNPDSEVIRIDGGMPRIIDDVTFMKVQTLLSKNLERGGSFKAKELYLLSGLIYCGGCNQSMHGNTRYCGRNKLKYVTYRCSGRSQKRGCHRKEINKGYIENFVLDMLYQNLFCATSIADITRKLNQYRMDCETENAQALEIATARLKTVTKEINATIELVCKTAISMDTVAEKMQELENQKVFLEGYIEELTLNKNLLISEEIVAELVEKSKEFVRKKNLPECKVFINSYIERVTVYEEKVEVKFRLYVPNGNKEEFKPLTITETLQNVYANYKDAV